MSKGIGWHVVVELDADSHAYLVQLATQEGMTPEQRASQLLTNALRVRQLVPITPLAVADKHHSIEAME